MGGDTKGDRRTERARETAVAVLSSIAIHSDLQASVCLEVLARSFCPRLDCTHATRVGAQVLPTAQSGTFLCEPLLRYFRGCRLADARWRLKEGLHLQLLQLQLSHPRCLDISVLLHVRTPHPLAFRQRVTVYLFGSMCGWTVRCCTARPWWSGRAQTRAG